MGCVEGSGVPVLYIGRTVPKGYGKLPGWVGIGDTSGERIHKAACSKRLSLRAQS
jgi:hypothetical protein